MWFGVKVMAYSLLFVSVTSQIINTWPNKKLLGYGYLDQLKDIFPGIIMAVVMGIIVSFGVYIPVVKGVQLVIQIAVGIAVYILGSKLFRLDSFYYIENILVKKFLHK